MFLNLNLTEMVYTNAMKRLKIIEMFSNDTVGWTIIFFLIYEYNRRFYPIISVVFSLFVSMEIELTLLFKKTVDLHRINY